MRATSRNATIAEVDRRTARQPELRQTVESELDRGASLIGPMLYRWSRARIGGMTSWAIKLCREIGRGEGRGQGQREQPGEILAFCQHDAVEHVDQPALEHRPSSTAPAHAGHEVAVLLVGREQDHDLEPGFCHKLRKRDQLACDVRNGAVSR